MVCNGQKYCGNGSCSVSEMMDFVTDLLKQKITEFEIEVKKGSNGSNEFHEKLSKSLEKKLADLNAKELSLWESQVDPDPDNRMPQHIFQALTAKLSKEREETEIALEKAKEAITTTIDYETKIVKFRDALTSLLDDEASVAEKNHLLKACIKEITYHRGQAERITGKGNGRGYTTPPIELDVKLML